jgi:hypothetical protein
MRPAETIANLATFAGRGAGTDSERRAAAWLRHALAESAGATAPDRTPRLEVFWCRPNWPLAHSWHIALAVAGSLVAVALPAVGAALVLVVLASVLLDATTGRSLGRVLTSERASQNVVAEAGHRSTATAQVHLVITANYDAGRCGLIYRSALRRPIASVAQASARVAPGWLGWFCLALSWLALVAILRAAGHTGTTLDVLQLVPTISLLLGLALLLDLASSPFGPAANDNGSGVAAARALVGALDAAPPRHLAVDLVLQGAGDGEGIGLGHYLRSRRDARRANNTIVLGFAACGGGDPRWWTSDGALVPARYDAGLRSMSAAIARDEEHLRTRGGRGRGHTPALPARRARLPAITLGCLDRSGLAPRSHQRGDSPEALEEMAIDEAVEFGLRLVDRIDASLAARARRLSTPA